MKPFTLSLNFLLPLMFIACGDKPVDDDGDGFLNTEECDDTNPAVSPNATDLVGDGFDQNCDGIDGTDADGDGFASVLSGGDDCDDSSADITVAGAFFNDNDNDGFGNPEAPIEACDAPFGFVEDNTDCNDDHPMINPEGVEICDGMDNDCDALTDDADDSVEGQLTVFTDADGDGFGDIVTETLTCDLIDGLVLDSSDCNDVDAAINPSAEEILADGIDNNCDAQELCYEDLDNDGFGSSNTIYLATDVDTFVSCDEDPTASSNWSDCDDIDSNVNPDAQEVCDDIDNDCDALIDDADDSTDLSTGLDFFADLDQDGYGDEYAPLQACEPAATLSTIIGDCDDTLASTHPLATDVFGDGVDQNCDMLDGTDDDQDGYASVGSGGDDCNDADALINPVALEECDDVDQNCNGSVDDNPIDGNTFYADTDGDGFGDFASTLQACASSAGIVEDRTDCNDSDSDTFPGAAHLDSITECLTDSDNDGFGDFASAVKDTCYTAELFDAFSDGWTGNAIEVFEDGVLLTTLSLSSGSSSVETFCPTEGSTIDLYFTLGTYPGDVSYILTRPDGSIFLDEAPNYIDGEFMTSDTVLGVTSATDCNDSNSAINILSNDLVGDNYDQNCDGIDGIDVDQDGFASEVSGGDDCNDSDASVLSDTDFDVDGYTCATDCDDYDPRINPGALDVAGDGVANGDVCSVTPSSDLFNT